MAMPLRGWEKWWAFLTRKPLTKDVELTMSAYVTDPRVTVEVVFTKGRPGLAVKAGEYTFSSNTNKDVYVWMPQIEYKE